MDMGGGAAIGSIANDVMGMAGDFAQMAKSAKDQGDINKAYEILFRYAEMDPEKAKIAAEQMGLQPDIVAGNSRSAQMDALRQFQNIGAKGGMDDAAIAANQQAGAQASRQVQAERAGQANKLQMQGMNPGSGAALAQGAQAAQAGYNTMASAGAQNAANAQMRALSAINASGRLAGDIASADEQRQQFNNEQRSARDRYNTGLRQSANQFNANAEMDVWQANLDKAKATSAAANAKGQAGKNLRDEQDKYQKDAGNRTQNIMGSAASFGG